MAGEISPEDAEARAAGRLRCVGFLVTAVWLAGLVVYVLGLTTDTGLRSLRIDPRAWRENVGFLVDWTSLIVLSGSFLALLWWPKKVVETIADLLARHRARLRAYLDDLLRNFALARAPARLSSARMRR